MRLAALCFTFLLPSASLAAEKDTRYFEMRIYFAEEGKFEDMLARFRNHTVKLFEKHGMTNIGYWTPIDNPERKLVYVLAYKDAAARLNAWKAFGADPEWQKAYKESEVKGKLVKKADTYFLTATDYSPGIESLARIERVFELRTYTASKGNLDALNARFRDHTLMLFKKHGMNNLWYWNAAEGQKGAGELLVYFLAHRSVEAAKASFEAFRKDPDWLAARKASEEKAGGPLTAKDGVKSEFMKATDFSPIK